MKNEKLLFCNLKAINISPNSSYNFDEMYNNNDILTYSESKSESILFLNKNKIVFFRIELAPFIQKKSLPALFENSINYS